MIQWCFVSVLLTFSCVLSISTNDAPENSLPDALRQSFSMINVSNPEDFREETIANASSMLSNTSLSDIENDNSTLAFQLRLRERKKLKQKTLIRNRILRILNISQNEQPNVSTSVIPEDTQLKIALLMERLQNQNTLSNGVPSGGIHLDTIQWMQSFYPSCTGPNNTDKSVWDHPESFRIFYDVPFGRYSSDITIMMAKLRLYKITGNVDPNFVEFDANKPRYNILEGLINSRAANGINVNIYQYIKSLKSTKRERKRLVDSRTVSIDYTGWVEFNVITSLNSWYRTNKNYGLDIEVEDAFGNKLNPNLYFQNMNCSSEVPAHDPPFPNLMEMHREIEKNDSSLFDNETYPTLDLRTAEVPRDLEDFDLLGDNLKERIVKKRSTESSCKKELEYVSFADIGLDEYILWPRGVLWTFCDGGCSPSEKTIQNREYFFSSWFQRLFKLKIKSAQSDCTVTRRESLPVVLYDGDKQITQTVLEDFVPTHCGCRAS